MLPLRLPRLWSGAGWLLVTGVVVASLLPADPVPGVTHADKLLHAGSYGLLMVWFGGIHARPKQFSIALNLFLLGLTLELAQLATATRSFDPADIAANASGILAGLLMARFVTEGWCRRAERLLGL